MKKLTLDIERLRVESFATEPAVEARGTVHGHAPTQATRPTCGTVCTGTQPVVSCYDPCG
ncbi:MAG TPA: hypothetical protein VF746_09860 [Longimicrobium sp.]|jgi:hypothetical protein